MVFVDKRVVVILKVIIDEDNEGNIRKVVLGG